MTAPNLVSLAVLLCGCSMPIWNPPVHTDAAFPQPQSNAEISRIRIDHTACFGSCPVYAYEFRRAGPAFYCGTFEVPMVGGYVSRIDSVAFDKLAMFLRKSGFFQLDRNYEAGFTDLAATIVAVQVRDSTMTIRNYGGAAPEVFWRVERVLDSIGSHLAWRSDSTFACVAA